MSAQAAAPQTSSVFPSEVEVITVDAVVVAGDGRPVTWLAREDFRVLEDGKPREIVSLEAYGRGGSVDVAPPFAHRRLQHPLRWDKQVSAKSARPAAGPGREW
jgi:hypothetical protein